MFIDPQGDVNIDKNEYCEMFINEAKEHLQNLNNALLTLEKDPKNEESLTVIFRAAHTIKGNAATMGFEQIRDVTHKLEDALDKLRKHELSVTTVIIDTLFECLDVIESLINGLSDNSAPTIDTSQVTAKLESIIRGSSVQPAKPSERTGADSKSQQLILSEDEIKAIEKEDKNIVCYSISVKLTDDCIFKGVRAHLVLANLEGSGKILKTIPSKDNLEKGEFSSSFMLVLLSKKKKELIHKLIDRVAEIESVEASVLEKTKENLEKYREQKTETTASTTASAAAKKQLQQVETVQSVRVGMDRLDKLMNLVGELLISKMRLEEIRKQHGLKELNEVLQTIDRLSLDIQDEIMNARMVPVDHIFGRFPRLVRDLSHQENKKIELIMEGSDIDLDRTVLDRIGDPLVHLIRNSIDHGIETPEERKQKGKPETGTLKLIARKEKSSVSVEVIDDGKGLDPVRIKDVALEKKLIDAKQALTIKDQDLYNFIFLPGFSTKKVITETSGRGVGMDVVKSIVDSIGGKLKIESELNKGTKLTITLPLTLAILQALLIKVCDETYAIPVNAISETIKIKSSDIKKIKDREVIIYRKHELPIFRINHILNLSENSGNENLLALVVQKETEQVAFIIDSIIGEQQIIIKTLGEKLKNIKGIAGGTILGDGKVALILDINTLVEIA